MKQPRYKNIHFELKFYGNWHVFVHIPGQKDPVHEHGWRTKADALRAAQRAIDYWFETHPQT